MRYTDKERNTLKLNECMTADSFLMEPDVYTCELEIQEKLLIFSGYAQIERIPASS